MVNNKIIFYTMHIMWHIHIIFMTTDYDDSKL